MVPWYERPDAKPPDIRDALEHAAVEEALAVIADTIALTHLVVDHPEIAEPLSAEISPAPLLTRFGFYQRAENPAHLLFV